MLTKPNNHSRDRTLFCPYPISFKLTSLLTVISFIWTSLFSPFLQLNPAYASVLEALPQPNQFVKLSASFSPSCLRGLKFYPDDPLRFDFIIDEGGSKLDREELKEISTRLIRHFLASLTIPEQDLWVNLSPAEKDKVIPLEFGLTDMGQGLLAQDYLLKQLVSSLTYPDSSEGKQFWDRVYQKARELFGTTNIPINTYNKIWIVPDKAEVFEDENKAIIGDSHLKVMLEEDYLILKENLNTSDNKRFKLKEADVKQINNFSSKMMREVVLPEIEKEINQGKTFQELRQIYHSLILATWFKQKLKNSILNQAYFNQKKTKGIDSNDPNTKEKIYQLYLQAYKQGLYDYIKKDTDPTSGKAIKRRYFSGGVDATRVSSAIVASPLSNMPKTLLEAHLYDVAAIALRGVGAGEAVAGSPLNLDINDIQEVKEGQIRNPVHLNFAGNVETDWKMWEKSNQEKTLHCVAQLEGITDGQKLYLAASLFGYAQNTGEHNLSGSIANIGFVPERQSFKIETVDTQGKQLDPQADYGPRKQHYEVSLRDLQGQFGFSDLLMRNRSKIPPIAITSNPENSVSSIKIIPLVLARMVHPERIRGGNTLYMGEAPGEWLRVFYEDVSGRTELGGAVITDYSKGTREVLPGVAILAKLTLEDFYLNELEKSLIEAKTGMKKLQMSVFSLIYGGTPLSEYLPRSRSLLRKLKGLVSKEEQIGTAAVAQLDKARSESFYSFTRQVETVILSARGELRFLNQQEIDELIIKLNAIIKGFQEGLDSVSKLFSKYPEVAQKGIRREDGKTAAKFLEETSEALEHLKTIRNSIAEPSSLNAVKNGDGSNLPKQAGSPAQGQSASSAMDDTKGGIDFNPAALNIEVKGNSASSAIAPAFKPVPIDLATFQGFTFQIIKLEPVANLEKIING